MGLWKVVEPEATTNLITNPSFEGGTTGWTAYGAGSTIALGTNDPPFGLYNLAITPSSGLTDGAYFALSLTADITYTFSIYVKGVAGVPYQVWAANPGTTSFTSTDFVGDGQWHRYETTFTPLATAPHWLLVDKDGSASTGVFYIDGAQCEALDHSTTYCDGSLSPPQGFTSAGTYWNGVAHASTSGRYAVSRAGGQTRDLEDDYGVYVANAVGAGAPPVMNIVTPYVQLPGAKMDRTKINARQFTLLGTILDSTSLANFHDKRARLVDLLMPDDTKDPLLIRYSGASPTLEIAAYYDGGAELGTVFGYNESVGLRFLAPYPYWREVIE